MVSFQVLEGSRYCTLPHISLSTVSLFKQRVCLQPTWRHGLLFTFPWWIGLSIMTDLDFPWDDMNLGLCFRFKRVSACASDPQLPLCQQFSHCRKRQLLRYVVQTLPGRWPRLQRHARGRGTTKSDNIEVAQLLARA